MINRAYIFIETAMGRSREVALALQKCEWVEFVERVTGPYDVVVMAQGYLHNIDDVISDGLRPIDGVIRAVVCPVSTVIQGGVPALVHSGFSHTVLPILCAADFLNRQRFHFIGIVVQHGCG